MRWFWLALTLTGCGDKDADSGLVGDSGQAGDSGDTAAPPEALLGILGSATGSVDGFTGTETHYAIAEGGEGDDLCRLGLTLQGTAARTDCADCTWAWDITLSDVRVETDSLCAAFDLSASALEGSTVSYGYIPEYYGHAEVLMVYEDGAWGAGAWASLDEETGTLVYDRQLGLVPYEAPPR